MNAIINPKLIAIESHSIRPEVNCEFLTISCPNGWDDVKKLLKKVLQFEGKNFTYRAWNSDKNVCYFSCPIEGKQMVAKIV